jgi:hypothetical protein
VTKWKSNAVMVPGHGVPCPRCNVPMAIFAHREVNERQKRAPFFYRRWYRCYNASCKTTLVMRDEDRVWNISGEDRANLEQWLTRRTVMKRA